MNTWHSIPLGDGMTASMPSAQIEALFGSLFAAVGDPLDMAVFTHSESEGRLHCEVIAYFSPRAAGIAETFDAHPCAQTARADLSLLAGDEHSWQVLFPQSSQRSTRAVSSLQSSLEDICQLPEIQKASHSKRCKAFFILLPVNH